MRTGCEGARVLVVEDEIMVALDVRDLLRELGCIVAGIAHDVRGGLSMSSPEILDAAILDVNLGMEQVFPVADKLQELGVPFIFATGYGPADLSTRYPGREVLHKPYRATQLAEALGKLRQEGSRQPHLRTSGVQP